MKKILSALAALPLGLAAIPALSSCTPPPGTWCPEMQASNNILDNYGHGIEHLSMRTTHCIDPYGLITRSSYEQFQSSYGYLGIFSGADLIASPKGVSLVNGPFTGSLGQYDSGRWDMALGFTVYGYGYHVGKGSCWINAPVWRTSGGGRTVSNAWYALGSAYGVCTDFSSTHPFETTENAANNAAWAKMTPAQRAEVTRDKAAVNAWHLPARLS